MHVSQSNPLHLHARGTTPVQLTEYNSSVKHMTSISAKFCYNKRFIWPYLCLHCTSLHIIFVHVHPCLDPCVQHAQCKQKNNCLIQAVKQWDMPPSNNCRENPPEIPRSKTGEKNNEYERKINKSSNNVYMGHNRWGVHLFCFCLHCPTFLLAVMHMLATIGYWFKPWFMHLPFRILICHTQIWFLILHLTDSHCWGASTWSKPKMMQTAQILNYIKTV